MTKYAVLPGMTIKFDDHSVLIRPLNDSDREEPEAFVERVDGTGVNPELSIGHIKVMHSKRGFKKLKNIGWTTLEVEVPAPPIAAPKARF